MGAGIGGAQDGSRAADNPTNLVGGRGTGKQVRYDGAGLRGPRFSGVGGKFDDARLPDAPGHEPAGSRNGDLADAVGEAHFRFLAELGHARDLLLLSDATGYSGRFGGGYQV